MNFTQKLLRAKTVFSEAKCENEKDNFTRNKAREIVKISA